MLNLWERRRGLKNGMVVFRTLCECQMSKFFKTHHELSVNSNVGKKNICNRYFTPLFGLNNSLLDGILSSRINWARSFLCAMLLGNMTIKATSWLQADVSAFEVRSVSARVSECLNQQYEWAILMSFFPWKISRN